MSSILRYSHIPVLLNETVSTLLKSSASSNVFVDCTLGGGGHAELLMRSCPNSRLYGFDRDNDAIQHCKTKLSKYHQQVEVIHSSYVNIPKYFLEDNIAGSAFPGFSGVMADLGVSSHQIDTRDRGFSFLHDGLLDMRFGTDSTGESPNDLITPSLTAADLVNKLPEAQLASVFQVYGEEPYAREIARAIVAARKIREFRTTLELSRCVEETVLRARRFQMRAKRQGQLVSGAQSSSHPATRVFQALRIAVNKELDAVHFLIRHIPFMLAPGGVFAVITFHSLEDRLVKQCFRELCNKADAVPNGPSSLVTQGIHSASDRKLPRKKLREKERHVDDKNAHLLPPPPLQAMFAAHYKSAPHRLETPLHCAEGHGDMSSRSFQQEISQPYRFRSVFDTELLLPTEDEVELNRRSRSAKLRAIQRL